METAVYLLNNLHNFFYDIERTEDGDSDDGDVLERSQLDIRRSKYRETIY